jgi:hypothetical protein
MNAASIRLHSEKERTLAPWRVGCAPVDSSVNSLAEEISGLYFQIGVNFTSGGNCFAYSFAAFKSVIQLMSRKYL